MAIPDRALCGTLSVLEYTNQPGRQTHDAVNRVAKNQRTSAWQSHVHNSCRVVPYKWHRQATGIVRSSKPSLPCVLLQGLNTYRSQCDAAVH